MPEAPPSVVSPVPPELERQPVPAVVSHRRRRVISTVVVIIGVLAVLAAVAVWLLQRSSSPPAVPSATLTPSDEAVIPTAESVATPTPLLTSPLPAASLYLPQDQRNNLALTIAYARNPGFQLQLTNVERTFERPTIQLYAPSAGEAHSRLRLLDTAGTVLLDAPFKVITGVLAETHDAGLVLSTAPLVALDSSQTYLVVPVDPQRPPARVEIVGQNGEPFIQQDIVYDSLPQVTAAPPAARDVTADVLSPTPSPTPLSWWRRLLPSARAQNPPSTGSGIFTIAVINHNGAELGNTLGALRAMVRNLKPWSTHSARIRIVEVKKDVDLGCREVEGKGGGLFPLCPDQARPVRELAGVQWDTIIVVTGTQCNCGTADIGAPLMTVGYQASASLLGHELGHTVGGLVDEYYYKFNFQGGPPGPNCFEERTECEEKRNAFPSLECAPGCRSVSQFRPHTLLMHNEFAQPYGEYDECLIEGKLLDVIGGQTRCEPESTPTPLPSPGREPNFYGGRR